MTNLNLQSFTTLSIMLNDLYGFGSIKNFGLISGGFTTENFQFNSETGSYFLKRYNTVSTQRIHDITMAQERFASGGIPIITPVKNRHEEAAFFFDDAWWGVFPFVNGITKSSNDLTPEIAANLGTTLGKIHLIGLACNREDIQPITLWNKAVFTSDKLALEYIYTNQSNRREIDTLAIENLRLQELFNLKHPVSVSELGPENNCLIHGDFTPNNVFFADDGSVQSIYDLDKACVAPRGYEVARSTLITCFDHGWDEKSFVLADAFLKAYLKVCPMSLEEFSNGFNIYVADFMHMTWLEKKVLLYHSKRHEQFVKSSHERARRLLSDFDTLAERLYPNEE